MIKFFYYSLLILFGSISLYFFFIAYNEHNFWFLIFAMLLSIPIFIVYNNILQKVRMNHELSEILNSILVKKAFEDFYSEQNSNEIKDIIDKHYSYLYEVGNMNNLLDNLEHILRSKEVTNDQIQPLTSCLKYMKDLLKKVQ